MNYVDSVELLANAEKWRLDRNLYYHNASKLAIKPIISNGYMKQLMLISENLLTNKSWNGYSEDWKTEMLGDSIEMLLMSAHKFSKHKALIKMKEKKYEFTVDKLCFAYFTKCISRCFQKRINEEKLEVEKHAKAKINLSNDYLYEIFLGETNGSETA